MHRADGTRRIARFVEKPSRAVAARLVRERALWNSFILVARASALVELIERRFPVEVAAFQSVFRQAALTERLPRELEKLYARVPEIDFSRDVVEGADAALGVIRVPPCGWSDLGTPQRVAKALAARNGRPGTIQKERSVSGFQPHINLAEAHVRLMSELARATAAQMA
jgi:mannose-1-phosphate guanylyltransferase